MVEDIFEGTVAGEGQGLAVDHGVGAQTAVAETGHVLEAGPLGGNLSGLDAEGVFAAGEYGVAARGAAGFADADLQGMLGRPVLTELVVELGRGPHVGRRQVVVPGKLQDVVVGHRPLALVDAGQFVVDGPALTEKLVLQGDEVARHGQGRGGRWGVGRSRGFPALAVAEKLIIDLWR